MSVREQLEMELKELGISNIGVVPVTEVPFEPSLLDLCKQNHCGRYGTNWVCPPHCGDIEDNIAKAKAYEQMLVFQKVYRLEDSFDFEGMTAGKDDFKEINRKMVKYVHDSFPDFWMLGPGGCSICEKCTVHENLPCKHPDEVCPALESCGVFVSELAGRAGLKYINGQNTVTYFAGVLYNER